MQNKEGETKLKENLCANRPVKRHRMNRLVLLILAMFTLAAVQLPTIAAPARKHPTKTAEGPRSTIKTTGAQMDAQFKPYSPFRENFPPARLSIMDESCPYVKVTLFMFGKFTLTDWRFAIRWDLSTQKKVAAFKITSVIFDEFHTKLHEQTVTIPDVFNSTDVEVSKGIYDYEDQEDTRIQVVKAYVSAVSLSDGTVWQAPASTHHWAESLGVGDAAPKDNQKASSAAVYPDLSASFDLAAFVDKNNGQLPFSVRDAYSQKYAGNMSGPDRFWFKGSLSSDDNTPIGHRYIAINSLGKSNLSAKEAAILLDQNIETLFPGDARGENESQIQQGIQNPLPKFKLLINPELFLRQLGDQHEVPHILVEQLERTFHVQQLSALVRILDASPGEVECANVSDYHFSFQTVPGQHILQGVAIHGVFKDSAGELWMFQQGSGPAEESWLNLHNPQGHITYTIAEAMWRIMSSNFRRTIQSQSRP